MTDTPLLIPTDWVNRLMAFGTEVVSPESAAEFLADPPFDPYHARDAHGRSLLMLACRADARTGRLAEATLAAHRAWAQAPEDVLATHRDARGRSLALYALSVQSYASKKAPDWLREHSPLRPPRDFPGLVAQGSWGADRALDAAGRAPAQPPATVAWPPSEPPAEWSARWVPLTHHITWRAPTGQKLAWADPAWWWGPGAPNASPMWHDHAVLSGPVDPALLAQLRLWGAASGLQWAHLFANALTQWSVPNAPDPHWGFVEDLLYHITTGAPLDAGRPEWEAMRSLPVELLAAAQTLVETSGGAHNASPETFSGLWRRCITPYLRAHREVETWEGTFLQASSAGARTPRL